MGCDIHAYVELWDVSLGGNEGVSSLAGEWELGRSYILFGLMAGVRSNIEPPVVVPRGMPTNPPPSPLVFDTFYTEIVNQPIGMDALRAYYGNHKTWVLKSELDKYNPRPVIINYDNREFIEPLFYHTPAWLTLDEMLEVRKRYLISSLKDVANPSKSEMLKLHALQLLSGIESLRIFVGVEHEYMALNALIASMFAVSKSNLQTRLTFWFDS